MSSPLTLRSTVDLPAPLGPTMQATEPVAYGDVDALQDVAAAVPGDHAGQLQHVGRLAHWVAAFFSSSTKSSPR